MPLYLGTDDSGTTGSSLQDFAPTGWQKMGAAVREAWLESYGPSVTDYLRSVNSDDKRKITAAEAESMRMGIGGGARVSIKPKDNEYTAGQWTTILERQRELAAVKDVRERTPWELVGTPLRATAMFGAGIADPINLATAFVPWTKTVSALNAMRAAAASESFLVRTGARAVLGGADAGISTAVLEPLNYNIRRAVGDDYTAIDSLSNIAFGTAFGGGLHVIGGGVGDVFRGRFGRAAEVAPTAPVLNEPGMAARVDPELVVRASPEAERVGVAGERAAPETKIEFVPEKVQQAADAEVARLRGDTPAPVRAADGIAPEAAAAVPDAPAAPVGKPGPRNDLLAALKKSGGISPDLAREATGENGMRLNRALPGLVRREGGLVQYDQAAQLLADEGFLTPGIDPLSYEAAAEAEDLISRALNGERIVRWETRMQEDLAAVNALEPAPAADVAVSLAPETREAALRAAVAQALDGRAVDVEPIVGMDPSLQTHTIDDVVGSVDRGFSPESQPLADFEVSRAVAERNASAPKWDLLEAADRALIEADALLADTVKAGDEAWRYSRGSGVTPQTADELTDAIRSSFGEASDALLEAGRVKIVGTVAEIPDGPHPADVKGATAPDGTVYIVAENVSPAEARGMMLHEVGVHVGMEAMVGPDVFRDLKIQFDNALVAGESWAQKARAAVPADTPANLVHEEQLAYLVQNAPEMPIVQRIIAAVRAWAYRTFQTARERMALTEADFRAMAVAALHHAARSRDVAGSGGTSFGRFGRDVAQTETKAFRDWFGDSKVVDAEGRPLVVYHGSPDLRFLKEEAIFKTQKERLGFGRDEGAHWFTPSQATAKTYADPRRAFDYQNAEEGVIAAYIKLENPLIVDGGGQNWRDAQRRGKTSDVIAEARAAGHDGVVIRNVKDDYNNAKGTRPTDTYVVFESTQIKSAAGNNGQFDPKNPDIRYSRGETPDPSTAQDELKPYDEAVARAKDYAKVLRAAADKLANDADAVAAMRAALPDISKQEIDSLLGQLRKEVKGLRGITRSTREVLGAEDRAAVMQPDAMKAADTLANNLQMAAIIERRNAALNQNVRLKASSFLNQFRKPGLDFEGFRALLVGSERKRDGARLSVEAEQKQFRGEWLGGTIADMEKAGVWQAFTSGKFDRDVFVALHALGKGEQPAGVAPEAVKIAEVVHKYQEDARNTRNRFGAWIRDLSGYVTRQTHDTFKIRDAGQAEWVKTVLPLLDVPKMQRLGLISEVDPARSLADLFGDFAAGRHMKTVAGEDDMAAFGAGRNLAKRESASRVLYFKDGDAAFQYNTKFGQGRLAETVLQGLDGAAKSAGLLKTLGTNPEATLDRLFMEYEDSLRGDPERRAAFASKKGELKNLLATLDGTTNIPGNVQAAKVAAFSRAWMSMAKLGGMLISSITDLSNYAAEMRFGQDKNLLSGVLDGMGSLTRGRAKGEQKQILASLGVFHESMLGGAYHRFDNPDLMGGKTAAAMQTFFKFSGINWWTETLRDAYALTHSHYMASNAGKAWDALPESLRDMLALYKVDAGKWELLRTAPMQAADGRNYMTPEGVNTLPRQALETYIASVGRTVTDSSVQNLRDDLAGALRAMTIDRMHHAVIEPGARTRAFMQRGTQPGTVPGEFLRYVGQFKSFPVALIQMTLGREVYGRGYDTLGEYLRKGKGDMLGLASFLALSVGMGYAAMSIKDLIKGKNPRPVDDYRTWMAAFVQGGGLGIYGDFLFGQQSRTGGGFTASLAGPVFGAADTVMDLKTRLQKGDDVAAASFKAVLDNTPFMNLFYTRIALDYLFLHQIQESLNPGFLRRMEQRAKRDNGQTYWLPPSEAAR